MRYHPIYGVWKLHSGVDLAGVGCNAPIYAAHGGTVTYAGPNGDLGNFIQIDHGDGIIDRLRPHHRRRHGGAHRRRTSTRARTSRASARLAARPGCHLHFMVRVNGSLTDPVPFMRNQGISLG